MGTVELRAMAGNLEAGLRQMMDQRNELEIRIRRQEGALQLAQLLVQQEEEAAAGVAAEVAVEPADIEA